MSCYMVAIGFPTELACGVGRGKLSDRRPPRARLGPPRSPAPRCPAACAGRDTAFLRSMSAARRAAPRASRARACRVAAQRAGPTRGRPQGVRPRKRQRLGKAADGASGDGVWQGEVIRVGLELPVRQPCRQHKRIRNSSARERKTDRTQRTGRKSSWPCRSCQSEVQILGQPQSALVRHHCTERGSPPSLQL